MNKPKSMLELFDGHPERLVTNSAHYSEGADGGIDTYDVNGPRWCLMAALHYVYGDDDEAERYGRTLDQLVEFTGNYNMNCSQFVAEHGHAGIVAFCKKYNV